MTEPMYRDERIALHGTFTVQDCLEAVIEKYEDGFILCPLLETGGKCEECYENFERRTA